MLLLAEVIRNEWKCKCTKRALRPGLKEREKKELWSRQAAWRSWGRAFNVDTDTSAKTTHLNKVRNIPNCAQRATLYPRECKVYGAIDVPTLLPSEALSFLKQLTFNRAAQDPEEVTYSHICHNRKKLNSGCKTLHQRIGGGWLTITYWWKKLDFREKTRSLWCSSNSLD
jgi:hypothetical protein